LHSPKPQYRLFYLNKKDGTVVSVNAKAVRNLDGKSMIILNDLTQQKKYLNEIDFLKNHDLLTGLYNRTYFEKVILEIDNKSHFPLSIIIGDINGLRMINDIIGKKSGDEMLLKVANIISLACRETDIIARYGGDTFIVVLPNTNIEEVQKICKNILSLCSSESTELTKISISLGYSCKVSQNQSIDEVMNSAENYMMKNKMLEVKSYRNSFLASLKGMLYDKSYETEKHALRLTSLCRKIGVQMGLSEIQLNDLGLFSMLHDIGKIGINSKVLSKPGKLTDDEWAEMRKHSYIGYRIAKAAPELEGIANNILYHHERFDGKGYPDGLSGEEIPLLSRILSVADAYDAMVNDRCYRKAIDKKEAIAEIKKCSGTQFDPQVVNQFLKIVEN
jgi:diguanylate cyclase (GGDEF)-like protein